MKINKFANARNCNIIDTITVEDYISYIREGYDVKSILKARQHGKGSKVYNTIKTNRNAVTFNFLFKNGYKLNVNIKESTGLLFFDIDDSTFSLSAIDLNQVYILHKSFGGNGYSLIVKVNGITFDNFKEAYINIAKQLGIDEIYDKQARKRTQFTLLSYDKDIYVNNNSTILTPNLEEQIQKSITTPIKGIKKNKEKNKCSDTFLKKEDKFIQLKFSTTLDSYSEDCVYIPGGKEFVECTLPFNGDGSPRKIRNGEKHKWLSIYTNNLICLNPLVSYNQILTTLRSIVRDYCVEVVPEGQLKSIINYKLKCEAQGTLQPFGATQKKFWVNPTVGDKKAAYNAKRKSLGTDAIDDFFGDDILNINCKITYKVIAEVTGLSEVTIKRRITPEQKQIIKEINKQFKNR